MPTLLSWNVNRAVAKLPEQADAVEARDTDLVALQEVTATTIAAWRERLQPRLPHVISSLDTAPRTREPAAPRRLAPLVGSRWRLTPVDPPAVPWGETVVSVRIEAPAGPFELHAVHVPNSRNGWIKVETMEAVHARLDRREGPPRILCGDFNTPRSERKSGEILTFAKDRYGRLRPERGERWDQAELSLLTGLREAGMVDVFRHLHGYERKEISWNWPRFPRSGYRLDHVIASLELNPVRCEYVHELRATRLSDHSAMEVEFRPEPSSAR